MATRQSDRETRRADLQPRLRLDPGERRRRLLEVGIEAFSQSPYEAVTMADVAARAGASKALVFRYFDSKRELFLECLRHDLQTLAELTDPDPALPAGERFRAGLEALLDFVERRPYSLPARAAGELTGDAEAAAVIAEANDGTVDRIVARIGVPATGELRFAVDSWLLYVRDSTRGWIADRPCPRQRLIDLQIAAFRSLTAEALGVEPRPTGAGEDPPFLP